MEQCGVEIASLTSACCERSHFSLVFAYDQLAEDKFGSTLWFSSPAACDSVASDRSTVNFSVDIVSLYCAMSEVGRRMLSLRLTRIDKSSVGCFWDRMVANASCRPCSSCLLRNRWIFRFCFFRSELRYSKTPQREEFCFVSL